MTIPNRPETSELIATTRKTNFIISHEDTTKLIIIPYLKKIYPEFQGYKDEDIEVYFQFDHIEIQALKEETKRV